MKNEIKKMLEKWKPRSACPYLLRSHAQHRGTVRPDEANTVCSTASGYYTETVDFLIRERTVQSMN